MCDMLLPSTVLVLKCGRRRMASLLCFWLPEETVTWGSTGGRKKRIKIMWTSNVNAVQVGMCTGGRLKRLHICRLSRPPKQKKVGEAMMKAACERCHAEPVICACASEPQSHWLCLACEVARAKQAIFAHRACVLLSLDLCK